MSSPVNLLFNDSNVLVDGSYNGVTGNTEFASGTNSYLILGGKLLHPLLITFNDGFSFEDSFSNQPLYIFNDTLSFIDTLGLFLNEGILLFLNDAILFNDEIQEALPLTVVINDGFSFLDIFFTRIGTNLIFTDGFAFSDLVQASGPSCILLVDNANNFNDSLVYAEGFINESIQLSDSLSIQEGFTLQLPFVSLVLVLGDTLTIFTDDIVTSDIEMLNSYLRRYLNDVISN